MLWISVYAIHATVIKQAPAHAFGSALLRSINARDVISPKQISNADGK